MAKRFGELVDQQPEPIEPSAEAVAAQHRLGRRQVRSAVRPLRPLRVPPHADRAARDHALRQEVPAHLSWTGDVYLFVQSYHGGLALTLDSGCYIGPESSDCAKPPVCSCIVQLEGSEMCTFR